MPKRTIALVLTATLTLQTVSCYSTRRREIEPGLLPQSKVERILGVTTLDGTRVVFDLTGEQPQVRSDTIYAIVDSTLVRIPLSDVSRVWVLRREQSTGKTIGAVFGITFALLAVGAVIALATKESCPFVYSWDGGQYVFDAEPYGGAITQGLERDDYGELEHLRPIHGKYRLRVRNEVNEVQFSNLLELIVADHPEGTRVAADEGGLVHTLRAPQPPTSARDAQGRDLRPWLQATDESIWEPPAMPGPDSSYRQDIVLTFPKPDGAVRAALVGNAATGLWGSHMIRTMLELRGDEVDEWYATVDHQAGARDSLLAWNIQEELYALKIYVEEPTGWELRGVLTGGGPFIAEDRVVPLDVSRSSGPDLRIRIRPPLGFWALNSFAVDYSPDTASRVTRVLPSAALDHQGRDVLAAISTADDQYYEMPRTGDWADLTFPAPAPAPGLARTAFLHSRGYYRLNLPAGGEPRADVLREITEVPGATARLAAAEYAAYRAAQARAR